MSGRLRVIPVVLFAGCAGAVTVMSLARFNVIALPTVPAWVTNTYDSARTLVGLGRSAAPRGNVTWTDKPMLPSGIRSVNGAIVVPDSAVAGGGTLTIAPAPGLGGGTNQFSPEYGNDFTQSLDSARIGSPLFPNNSMSGSRNRSIMLRYR